jgi:hypothetical protein
MTAFERLFRERGVPRDSLRQWRLQLAAGSGYRVDPIPVGERWIKCQLDPDQEASEGPIIKAEERPYEPAPALRYFSRALP